MTSEIYGTASDGKTPLMWDVFEPGGLGPWNLILAISCSGFKTYSEAPSVLQSCIDDLVAEGNLVLAPHTRLVKPPGIAGQASTGCYPQPHQDIALAIATARTDPRVIPGSKIGGVGGSGGGTLCGWACCNGTQGNDKLDFGVVLSPATDYSDTTPDPGLAVFQNQTKRYVHSKDSTVLHNASLVTNLNTPNPMFIASADQDTMPLSQATDLTAALDDAEVDNYEYRLVEGRYHAFAIWPLLVAAGEVLPWILDQQLP